jgi:hypothetical protein
VAICFISGWSLPPTTFVPRLMPLASAGADVGDVDLVEPVDDDQLVHRDAVALHLLRGDDVHRREVPADHPVGVEAADLGPHRRLVLARQRVGEQLQLEAFLRRERLQDRDRLLAERVVGVDEADLDALQVALVLVLDVLHVVGHLAPVGRPDGEDPLEDVAVDRVAATDEALQHDVAVGHRARQHGARDRRRQEVEHHHALALELLVALDAALRLVAVVLRDDLDRVALDPALGVEDVGVVLGRLHDLRRDEGVGLRQVVAQAVLDRLRLDAAGGQREAGQRGKQTELHGASPGCGARSSQAVAADPASPVRWRRPLGGRRPQAASGGIMLTNAFCGGSA